jgi:hypothetical protein
MRRPYFFEIFTLANFALIVIVLWRISRAPLVTAANTMAILLPAMVVQTIVGIAIRLAVVPNRRQYIDMVRSKQWIVETTRIIIFSALSVHVYGWIKLSIPVLHPVLFDRQLWDLDQALFLGHSPNIFFLDLFSSPVALRFFDWTYANVFIASINIASIFFLSETRRERLAFTNSNTLMWLAGAWLYVLIPSLGPAYRFPEVWLPLSSMLGNTQQLQRILMTNYQHVLNRLPVNVFLGIAAFPSLHVAFEVLVTLWMRRVWRVGGRIFAVIAVIIFLGSVVTGWHYLIDAIAGVLLAASSYLAFAIWERRQAFPVAHASTD